MKRHIFGPWLSTCMVMVLAVGCAVPSSTARQTPQSQATRVSATQAPATATAPVGESNDDWMRIKASGKLIVGSAMGYPPFSYYNADFTADGFDLALVREIGRRLGLTVEVNDFAFDGVLGALQLKQVDVAIAAISITPDRQARVSFSDVYYAGEDAILALADSSASVHAVTDLAGKRVGVQRGSVYADWLINTLLNKSLMNAGDLLQYPQIDAAVRDLKDKHIDFVVTGLLPAQDLLRSGGLKLVGQGLNRQRFGIATRKGSSELLNQINVALKAIRADSTFNALTMKYLNVDSIVIDPGSSPLAPTPAPAPTFESSVCVNGMAFVTDLNFDDLNMTAPPVMNPNQRFAKGWRVRNSGNCPWAANYALAYAYGNSPLSQMGGANVMVGIVVQPGQVVDFSANLVAPSILGTYQGFWTMRDTTGLAFGEAVWMGVTITNVVPVALPLLPILDARIRM